LESLFAMLEPGYKYSFLSFPRSLSPRRRGAGIQNHFPCRRAPSPDGVSAWSSHGVEHGAPTPPINGCLCEEGLASQARRSNLCLCTSDQPRI